MVYICNQYLWASLKNNSYHFYLTPFPRSKMSKTRFSASLIKMRNHHHKYCVRNGMKALAFIPFLHPNVGSFSFQHWTYYSRNGSFSFHSFIPSVGWSKASSISFYWMKWSKALLCFISGYKEMDAKHPFLELKTWSPRTNKDEHQEIWKPK